MESTERCGVKYLVFGASLRRGSLNDRLASLSGAIVEEKGGGVHTASMADYDCPSYDQDVEAEGVYPPGAARLRDDLAAADALILASPEYNASMPGSIKNLIDWVSRYRPQPFNGKQALLLSASPSMAGGNRGLWALRIPLEHLGMRIYPDMFSLAQAHEAFGADGRLVNATLQQRLEGTIECFMDLVEAAKHYPAMKKQWVEFLGENPAPVIDRVETNRVQAA